MDSVAQFGRSLLIAADEIEGEAVTILVINELRSNIKVYRLILRFRRQTETHFRRLWH
ncbi:MAG: hypothetical protein ACTS46_00655 [Candidatus Hodgkinia cicadicola]